jgi:hypothetical protein
MTGTQRLRAKRKCGWRGRRPDPTRGWCVYIVFKGRGGAPTCSYVPRSRRSRAEGAASSHDDGACAATTTTRSRKPVAVHAPIRFRRRQWHRSAYCREEAVLVHCTAGSPLASTYQGGFEPGHAASSWRPRRAYGITRSSRKRPGAGTCTSPTPTTKKAVVVHSRRRKAVIPIEPPSVDGTHFPQFQCRTQASFEWWQEAWFPRPSAAAAAATRIHRQPCRRPFNDVALGEDSSSQQRACRRVAAELEERTESRRETRTSGTPSARGLALEQSLRGVVAPAIRRCYRGLDPFDGRRARSATAQQPGTGTADAPLIPLQPPCRGVAGRRRRDAHKAPARRKDRQRRQGRAPGRGMESVGNPHKLLFRSCGSTRNACRALPAPPARSAPAPANVQKLAILMYTCLSVVDLRNVCSSFVQVGKDRYYCA